MTVAVNDIVDDVEDLLKDSGNNRWAASFHIASLNEGQDQIVMTKPDTNPQIESVALSAGVWQDLPTGGLQLLDVTTNMGSGATRGRGITMVEKAVMDRIDPTWYTTTQASVIKNVIYDPTRWPKKFMVYPPSTASNYIEIIYGKLPTDVSAGENIGLADEYYTALMEWMLFRAYSIDMEIPGQAERAMAHISAFAQILGRLDVVEKMVSPPMKPKEG